MSTWNNKIYSLPPVLERMFTRIFEARLFEDCAEEIKNTTHFTSVFTDELRCDINIDSAEYKLDVRQVREILTKYYIQVTTPVV